MALKTMLYSLTRVNQWLNSPDGKAAKVPADLRENVAAALAEGAEALTKMGRPTNHNSPTGLKGRPPAATFLVEIDGQDSQLCVGGNAAAEAVNAQMAAWGMKERVTPGNLSVSISRTGAWFRVVGTDNGELVINVTRPKPKAEASTE